MSTVETSYGKLQGQSESGVTAFKGIPFAEPPVGDLRWRPPQPVKPWKGIYQATEYGSCAMQSTIPGTIGELIGIATGPIHEDCLYLNLWTPSCDTSKRPVMVWIHGGGNTVGSGSQPRVNGSKLARTGDVVVVTLNYRLGAFGFLHAPEIGASGNEALLDQVAGLRWVKAEIEAFGGDPNNVTVFGQSAGGFDIAQLMAMPAAKGSFDKAVPMSGSLTQQQSATAAYQNAESFASALQKKDLKQLRDVPADVILQQQIDSPGQRWAPVLDGEIIQEDAKLVHERGDNTRSMPLMIGHTRDESTLFTKFNPQFQNMTEPQLAALLSESSGEDSKDVLEAYLSDRAKESLSTQPLDIWAAVSTDRMFRIPAIRTTEAHRKHSENVWFYRFDYESPAVEGILKSCHSLDIPFVWGTHGLDRMKIFCGTEPAVSQLSKRLMGAYLSFARHGDPNADADLGWDCYGDARATMCFDVQDRVEHDPMPATRQLYSQ